MLVRLSPGNKCKSDTTSVLQVLKKYICKQLMCGNRVARHREAAQKCANYSIPSAFSLFYSKLLNNQVLAWCHQGLGMVITKPSFHQAIQLSVLWWCVRNPWVSISATSVESVTFQSSCTVILCSAYLLSQGVTEEERLHLHPPTMKLSRSLSVPGPEDIPPPPDTSAPEPPLSAGGHTDRRSAPTHFFAVPPLPPSHHMPHSQTQHRVPPNRRVRAWYRWSEKWHWSYYFWTYCHNKSIKEIFHPKMKIKF